MLVFVRKRHPVVVKCLASGNTPWSLKMQGPPNAAQTQTARTKRGRGQSRWWASVKRSPMSLLVWDGSVTSHRAILQGSTRPHLVSWWVIQGDHSACAKTPVDFKTKVPPWLGLARPKQNLCFEVKGRFCTSWMVTLYGSLMRTCCILALYLGGVPAACGGSMKTCWVYNVQSGEWDKTEAM